MGLADRLRGAWDALTGADGQQWHADFMVYTDADGREREVSLADARRGAYYSNAFRACLLAKARPLASLPVHVYEREHGVRRESNRRFARALSRLLRQRWNSYVTAAEGTRWLMMTKDTLGNAFCRVEYAGGMPVAIWPMSGTPTVERTPRGPVFEYGGDDFTPAGRYLAREVVWVKSPVLDPSGVWGVSLAQLAARELSLSIDLEEFYSSVVGGEGNFPGWLETDQKLDPQDVADLRSQLADGGGVVNAGKLRIFDKGLAYKTNGQTAVDMSLVEQERWILQQTCRTLSVPPQEVFDLSNATYSNIEQGALDFANKTLVPECSEMERAFSCLLWEAGLEDCYVQLDMNGLLRGSYKERMEGYRIGINAGFYSPNMVLAKEDEEPFEGGDVRFRSSAYIPVDPETGEELAPRSSASFPGSQGEGAVSPDPEAAHASGAALAVIHDDMRRRIRDRVAETGDTPKTRDFARRVLAPLADAYEVDGIAYDLQSDIEETING